MKNNTLASKLPFALAIFIGSAAALNAADVTWNGGTGEYDTGSNWSSGAVPSTNDNVTISSGVAQWHTSSGSTGSFSRKGTGDTLLNGTGELQIGNSSTADDRFNSLSGGGGTFTIADSAKLSFKGAYFLIAAGTTTGTVNQTGGSVVVETGRGFFLSDSDSSQGSVYNLSGGTLSVTSTGSQLAPAANDGLRGVWLGKRGASGQDALRVSGSAVATFTYAPTNADREARVLISDASLITVANTAKLTFDNYTSVDIGGKTDGGSIDTSQASQIIVTGGELVVSNSLLNVGASGDGELIISGGTVTVDDLALSSKGTINLNNGSLFVTGNLTDDAGILNYSGGVFTIYGDFSDLGSLTWFNDLSSGATASFDGTYTTIIPEPSTYAAFGAAGLLGLLILRRRRS